MPKPPFAKDEMLEELKRVVLVQANHLHLYGSPEAAELLMGFEPENAFYPYCEEDPARVDLSRFGITRYMGAAYDYAFQVGKPSRFGDDTAQDINEFRHGANMQATNGERSPMADPDSRCRVVTDTAFARWNLENGNDLTIRELALLAGMREPAVRNSLSAEMIKVEAGRRPGEPGTVDRDVAYGWLRRRRGFIASRDPAQKAESRRAEVRALFREHSFAWVFSELLKEGGLSAERIAAEAGVDASYVASLADGRPPLDVEAARRVAAALDLDVPHFAGVAVEAALRGADAGSR
jgi:hypothetical protein